MARVLTNNTTLSIAVESSTIGTLPGSPSWNILEPNEVKSFGAEIKTVARTPISKSRQRRKGTVVDLDSSVEYEADLTMSEFDRVGEAFMFARAVNYDMIFPVTAVNGATDEYTIAALAAGPAGKLQHEAAGYATLVYARGFTNAANNGLKVLDSDPVTTDTAIGVTDTGLVTEASAPANATVELAGVRAKTGDLAITVSGTTATLTNGNNAVTSGLDFTTLGLTVGQTMHVGGLLVGQQFSAGFGYGRIVSITATTIVLDKLVGTLATDTGAGDTVDLLFGRFIRNVDVGTADYLERSFHVEQTFPDLFGVGTPGYQYAIGNLCNELEINLPLTSKATMSVSMIGTDTENPTSTRKTNAASALEPNATSALNTTSDIARMRLADVDETGLSTDFKELTLTLNNNVSPEKVLSRLGAKYMNAGIFEVSIEAQLVFTEPLVVNRIRSNATISFDFIVKNDNGAIAFDIPELTLGDGSRDYPVNESVLINLSGNAHKSTTTGVSLGISMFPIVP